MNFKKWVKSKQTVGYNGALTVHIFKEKTVKQLILANIFQRKLARPHDFYPCVLALCSTDWYLFPSFF